MYISLFCRLNVNMHLKTNKLTFNIFLRVTLLLLFGIKCELKLTKFIEESTLYHLKASLVNFKSTGCNDAFKLPASILLQTYLKKSLNI